LEDSSSQKRKQSYRLGLWERGRKQSETDLSSLPKTGSRGKDQYKKGGIKLWKGLVMPGNGPSGRWWGGATGVGGGQRSTGRGRRPKRGGKHSMVGKLLDKVGGKGKKKKGISTPVPGEKGENRKGRKKRTVEVVGFLCQGGGSRGVRVCLGGGVGCRVCHQRRGAQALVGFEKRGTDGRVEYVCAKGIPLQR